MGSTILHCFVMFDIIAVRQDSKKYTTYAKSPIKMYFEHSFLKSKFAFLFTFCLLFFYSLFT